MISVQLAKKCTDIMFLNADLTLPFYSYLLTLHTEKNPVCEQ